MKPASGSMGGCLVRNVMRLIFGEGDEERPRRRSASRSRRRSGRSSSGKARRRRAVR